MSTAAGRLCKEAWSCPLQACEYFLRKKLAAMCLHAQLCVLHKSKSQFKCEEMDIAVRA